MARANTVIEIKVNQEKQQHQGQIAAAAGEVRRDEAELSTVLDKVAAVIENMPEYDEVVKLSAKTEQARERLNMAVSRAPGLNDLKEDAAVVRAQLRNSRGELSQLLVSYIATYQEKSLMVNHEHRAIKIKAEIGQAIERQEILAL